MSISGNLVGSYSQIGKTFIIEYGDGNEITAVVVDQETVFTATDNDVREGYVYAGDSGVSVGSKNIPSYHTTYGYKFATPNKEIKISVDEFDFSNLFVTIATYDQTIENSVAVTYVAVDGSMYAVGSGEKISDITVDLENEQIDLGMTVSIKSVVRYLVTREEF